MTFPPLPTSAPFLSILTFTHRPERLVQCMASVQRQTAVADVEHVIVPDYVGYGIVRGMFQRLSWYATALRGRYVWLLSDDDVVAAPDVVAALRHAAHDAPEVIVGRVRKGRADFPREGVPLAGAPVVRCIDCVQYVVRRDIWLQHVTDYGHRYAGDYDFAAALWAAGYPHVALDALLVIGGSAGHHEDAVDV